MRTPLKLEMFENNSTPHMIMNDRHLDPPEEPEIPECCDLEMEVDHDGNCRCTDCGSTIDAPEDIEPPENDCECVICGERSPCECGIASLPEDPKEFDETKGKCPHGETWGDCGTCDFEADLAYDQAKEARFFG